MDFPITPVPDPDDANALRLFTIASNTAASLQTKLELIRAGLESTLEPFKIYGYEIAAAGDGGLFMASFSAGLEDPPAQLGDLVIPIERARFVCIEAGTGDNDLVPFATGDAEISPTGERLQRKVRADFPAVASMWGISQAGCNSGRRFVAMTAIKINLEASARAALAARRRKAAAEAERE